MVSLPFAWVAAVRGFSAKGGRHRFVVVVLVGLGFPLLGVWFILLDLVLVALKMWTAPSLLFEEKKCPYEVCPIYKNDLALI